jgi:hypothetical protein
MRAARSGSGRARRRSSRLQTLLTSSNASGPSSQTHETAEDPSSLPRGGGHGRLRGRGGNGALVHVLARHGFLCSGHRVMFQGNHRACETYEDSPERF